MDNDILSEIEQMNLVNIVDYITQSEELYQIYPSSLLYQLIYYAKVRKEYLIICEIDVKLK